jgi:hypothetical protein
MGIFTVHVGSDSPSPMVDLSLSSLKNLPEWLPTLWDAKSDPTSLQN